MQSDDLIGIVGYRWRITEVGDSDGTLAVPASMQREIGFTDDGYVLGHDTVNALQGHYQLVAGGYTVRNSAMTAAGWIGTDPVRRRIIAAVKAMFLSILLPNRTVIDVTVEATLHGDRLSLRNRVTALNLERAAAQPAFFAGEPPTPAPQTD